MTGRRSFAAARGVDCLAGAVYATRARLGMTQREFGDAIGYETKSVAEIEREERAATIWMLLKIGALAEGEARARIIEELRARFAAGGVAEFVRELPGSVVASPMDGDLSAAINRLASQASAQRAAGDADAAQRSLNAMAMLCRQLAERRGAAA